MQSPARRSTKLGITLFNRANLIEPGTTTVKMNTNNHIAIKKMHKKNNNPNVTIAYKLNYVVKV